MRLSIFGLGYVGSTSMACLAELGHEVYGVDVNEDKVALVNQGQSPVFEPDVSKLLAKHRKTERVRAGTDPLKALEETDAALVCVGTPSLPQGPVDVGPLAQVIGEIADARQKLGRAVPVIVRSTALPAVHRDMMALLDRSLGDHQPTAYCVHPEFMRAGQAVDDFMSPPEIVFGCTDNAAVKASEGLYPGIEAPVFHTDPMTAALIKYAANCFHAVKVTFANEMGMLCRAMDVDSRKVMELFRQDTKLNISPRYLTPGFAFGGSCLPKDLRAVLAWGRQNMVSTPMLEQVLPSNDHQVENILRRIAEHRPKTVGLFGLTFKAETDDLRESPMVRLAEHFSGKGCEVRIFDPALVVDEMVGANRNFALSTLPHLSDMLVDNPGAVVGDTDVVIIARDFPSVDWRSLDWPDGQLVVDLCGNLDLSGQPVTVEGLYWDNTPGKDPS